MNKVYVVWFRDHRWHSEDPSKIIGVYTTRDKALAAGRGALFHEEDEYWISERALDTPGPGETIWGSSCDSNANYRSFFAEFWPEGFPVSGALGESLLGSGAKTQ